MKKWIYVILLIFFTGFAAFAGYKLFSGLWSYKQGDDAYNKIKEKVVTSAPTKESEETEDAGTEEEDTEPSYTSGDGYAVISEYELQGKIRHMHADIDYMIWPIYEIDFDVLKDISDEVTGWIRIEDTHVDYPVVQHNDNNFYIRHGIDGEPLNTGSIFVDYRVKNPFGQENTIIYGHNQRNSAMFHDLLLYREQEFADEHPYVVVYTPDGRELTYRVFSAYLTPSDSNSYSIAFSGSESLYSYLVEMAGKSEVFFGVSVTPEDQIITLSTCTNEADNQRMVVQAKLISTRSAGEQ